MDTAWTYVEIFDSGVRERQREWGSQPLYLLDDSIDERDLVDILELGQAATNSSFKLRLSPLLNLWI